jgi:hypothetical protein
MMGHITEWRMAMTDRPKATEKAQVPDEGRMFSATRKSASFAAGVRNESAGRQWSWNNALTLT